LYISSGSTVVDELVKDEDLKSTGLCSKTDMESRRRIGANGSFPVLEK
jgi:hypothetical protein